MQLTFLGTGSAMPTGRRFQSGYLLEANGESVLIDCGSGVLHALARTDTGYEGVDTVLLTHHHLDHVSDLDVLLKARWLAGEERLTVAGPPGTVELIENLLSVHEYMQDRLELGLRDLDPDDEYTLSGFDVTSLETRHSMQCFAYRLTPEGGDSTVTLSGDSEAFPGLVAFADGSDVLVHDCSFPDDVDVSNHPTPTSLGRALAEVEPDIGHLYLTHLYPHTTGRHEEMLDSIGEHYDGEVSLAPEGTTISLGEG